MQSLQKYSSFTVLWLKRPELKLQWTYFVLFLTSLQEENTKLRSHPAKETKIPFVSVKLATTSLKSTPPHLSVSNVQSVDQMRK